VIKVGIIGAGRLGTFHSNKVVAHPELKLVGVFDVDSGASEVLAKRHKITSFANVKKLLSKVDAVIVATIATTHYELGKLVLSSGKHLFVEKPICVLPEEADELVAVAKRSGLILQVGHSENFSPAWMIVKRGFEKIAAAEPIYVDAIRAHKFPFRCIDVGVVLDMMIHDIDLVLSLVQSPVNAVNAIGFYTFGSKNEDAAHAQVTFENGSIATFYASRIADHLDTHLKIIARADYAHIYFLVPAIKVTNYNDNIRFGHLNPEKLDKDTINSLRNDINFAFMNRSSDERECERLGKKVDVLAAEVNDFAESIISKKQPQVSGERAAKAVHLAHKILENIREKHNHIHNKTQH
jgi:predicted dehydrogenase